MSARASRGNVRVLFATIKAGGGHVATAEAMAEALHAHRPGRVETEVLDLMAELGFARLDARHKASWRSLLKRPHLVRLGQRAMDAAPRVTRAAQNALLTGFARRAARELNAAAPDLIVANHGWLATALTLSRRRYGLKVPLVIYATEPFDASALWAEPQAEHVIAPSAAARTDLVRLGVPAANVHVLGYPVKRAFATVGDDPAARAHLTDAPFTCLLTLGAEGAVSDALPLVESLLAEDLRLIAVAGRNQQLEESLRRLAERQPRLSVHGFTNRMPDLLAHSHVLIGKAGPASTMEAVASGRPVIATAYAGLNEGRVVRFLESRGLGSYAPTPPALRAALLTWRVPARRAEAARAAAALDFPGMSARIAAHLWRAALGERLTPERPAGAFETTSRASLAGAPGAELNAVK